MGFWRISPFTNTMELYEDEFSIKETPLLYNSSSPVSMFTLLIGALPVMVQVIIDTPFDGTAPTLSIGTAGDPDKYMTTVQVNLKGVAEDIYEVKSPVIVVAGSSEVIIATYVADGSSVGAARIKFHYHSEVRS